MMEPETPGFGGQLNSKASEVEQSRRRSADVLTEIRMIPARSVPCRKLCRGHRRSRGGAGGAQNAITERDALLTRFTDKHPEVVQASSKVEVLRKQFLEAVFRARETAAANLELMAKQTASLRERMRENEKLSTELELSLIAAKSRLEQLERNREVAGISYRSTLMRIEEARQAMDDFSASIQIIEEASLPRRQISPDPRVAFTTGPMLGVLIGFVFILVLDRLEDRITSVADIERHMSAKVLAMIPRVPASARPARQAFGRQEVQQLCRSLRRSAGSALLLARCDLTQVILIVSTQPEEGKTISSSNLAMTYAMSGEDAAGGLRPAPSAPGAHVRRQFRW